jgi:hypothetical protein
MVKKLSKNAQKVVKKIVKKLSKSYQNFVKMLFSKRLEKIMKKKKIGGSKTRFDFVAPGKKSHSRKSLI